MGKLVDPIAEQEALREATGRNDLVMCVNTNGHHNELNRVDLYQVKSGDYEYTDLQENYDRATEVKRWAS